VSRREAFQGERTLADKTFEPIGSDDFTAAHADEIVKLIAAGADKVGMSAEDAQWCARMFWTYGQVLPIADAATAESYAHRAVEITKNKAGLYATSEDFFRSADGALAAALQARVIEWNERTGN
jgi:hypothetical protein